MRVLRDACFRRQHFTNQADPCWSLPLDGSRRHDLRLQPIEKRGSPSSTWASILGNCLFPHNSVRNLARYRSGPPSGRVLRSSGHGIKTKYV